jgi:excinuclease ABC subunit A
MISLRRVAVHNLKNIDLDLPLGKLIVFCGRSGSGKSSLALDTLYAEGQRRYIETFSPAMRQYLEKIEKPEAESLEGIPPAIAVTSGKREPTTVGEATELFDDFAMLFAQVGHVFCPKCSRLITSDSPQTVWQQLAATLPKGAKLQIAFAPPLEPTAAEFAALWKEQGFLRGCLENSTFHLDNPIPEALYQDGLLLIVDRLSFDPNEEERILESLETAFDYGEGKCVILCDTEAGLKFPSGTHPALQRRAFARGRSLLPDPARVEQQTLRFSRSLSCEYCNVHVPPLTTKLFRTDWIHHVHLHADQNSPTMSELNQRTIAELMRFFKEKFSLPNGEGVVRKIQSRLRFLHQVGLDTLTLARPMDTLSSGEGRRVMLAAVLGSSLVDMLYV